jgi:membrane-associated phospholipid phosphatase
MDSETNPGVPDPTVVPSLASFAWMWGVPLFALVALVILLASGTNIALFNYLNQLMSQAGDALWSHLTILGDTTLALMLILPLFGRRPALVWQFFLAAIFATLWSHGMKNLFATMRPPAVLPEGSYHLIGPMFEQNSFPSGHTTTIFVLAGLICLQHLENRLKLLLLMLAVLVGLSRIACGVHWPVDVLGGMFGGWLAAVAAVWLSQHWHGGLNIWFQRVLALLITLSAVWSILYYDSGIPGTWLFQFTLTAICLGLSINGQYRLFKMDRFSTDK